MSLDINSIDINSAAKRIYFVKYHIFFVVKLTEGEYVESNRSGEVMDKAVLGV